MVLRNAIHFAQFAVNRLCIVAAAKICIGNSGLACPFVLLSCRTTQNMAETMSSIWLKIHARNTDRTLLRATCLSVRSWPFRLSSEMRVQRLADIVAVSSKAGQAHSGRLKRRRVELVCKLLTESGNCYGQPPDGAWAQSKRPA